ncbi:MAG: hypothetical protein IPK07_09380 [Deltaproteobacteria bacterium]|nr:hypothetical protein [Deltaproteobacteria bacterium]
MGLPGAKRDPELRGGPHVRAVPARLSRSTIPAERRTGRAGRSPLRLDGELTRSAAEATRHMSPSVAEQIAHWARIGRALEHAADVSIPEIQAVLEGAPAATGCRSKSRRSCAPRGAYGWTRPARAPGGCSPIRPSSRSSRTRAVTATS